MAREVEFVIDFGPLDRYRQRHISDKGKIQKFVIQYETKVGAKWYPVVRYDTSHGFFHKDLMRLGKRSEKILIDLVDRNKALTLAANDIRNNWEKYKEAFLQEVKNED